MKKFLFFIVFILASTVFSVAQSLTDSLCAYYPFNGYATDASGNGNNGSISNATLTADRYGNSGSAYYFSSAAISYMPIHNFKPTTFPISISAWIKSNCGAIPAGMIFKNNDSPDSYDGVALQVNANGTLQVFYGDGGPASVGYRRSFIGTTNVNDNSWHFVAGVIRGPLDMDLYVDCDYDSGYYDGGGGALHYTTDGGMTAFADLYPTNYFYKGAIDEIRLYHRELTLTDLQHLYAYPTPPDGLSVTTPPDTIMCTGTSFIITTITNGIIYNFNWSNGATTNFLSVNQSGNYFVTVNNGCSYVSDTTLVTFVTCEGINDFNNLNAVSINYVEENNSVFISNLNSMHNQKFNLDLYNVVGQKIISSVNIPVASNFEFKLPTSLASGIYLVRIMIGNISKTRMIVKNKL